MPSEQQAALQQFGEPNLACVCQPSHVFGPQSLPAIVTRLHLAQDMACKAHLEYQSLSQWMTALYLLLQMN